MPSPCVVSIDITSGPSVLVVKEKNGWDVDSYSSNKLHKLY